MVEKYSVRWIILLLSILAAQFSYAQIYSTTACISNPTAPPTGASGQTNAQCQETTRFFDLDLNSATRIWDFGTGTTSLDSRNTLHNFSTPGVYTVSLTTVDANGVSLTHTKNITAGYYPQQPLFDKKTQADTTICDGKSITLDPFKGSSASGLEFFWFPNGETTSTIEVNESGCYSVEVKDPVTGCTRSAKITVKICYEDNSSNGGAEKWYFGHGAGLEFTMTGTEVPRDSLANDGTLDDTPEIEDPVFEGTNPGSNEMKADEAAAIVLDNGNGLVLYTDGKKLYAGEGDDEIKMADGSDFTLSAQTGTQGVALVPKPVCNSCDFINYYLITVDQTTGLLSYSVVDMRYNDRKGAVVETGIPIAAGITGKITIERSSSDSTYHIYAYHAGTNSFETLSLDSTGITFSSVSGSNVIPEPSGSYMATSPDGSKVVHGLVIDGQNYIETFSRDVETGALTNPVLVNLGHPAPPRVYGLAFSPNNNLLYVSLTGPTSKLLQVDVSSGDAATMEGAIILISERNEEYGALALGPKYGNGEKYIYLSVKDKSFVPYIQEPNEIGDAAAVGFTYVPGSALNGVAVSGTTKLGFPNVVAPAQAQEGSGLSISYSGNCLNVRTFLTAQKICDPMENEFEWEIEGKKYEGKDIVHRFSGPGWKTVKLLVKVKRKTQMSNALGSTIGGWFDEACTEVPYEGRIYIKPAPVLGFPDPLPYCFRDNPQIPFNPRPTGGSQFTFDWMTSLGTNIGRDSVFEFKVEQTYILTVQNEFLCETTKQFDVVDACEPVIHIPTAITPDGTGPNVNESLKIFTKYLERPVLEIYNRWGQMVFRTDNLDVLWDGKYENRLHANQVYPYVLRYYAEDFPERGEQRYRGTVLVLSNR